MQQGVENTLTAPSAFMWAASVCVPKTSRGESPGECCMRLDYNSWFSLHMYPFFGMSLSWPDQIFFFCIGRIGASRYRTAENKQQDLTCVPLRNQNRARPSDRKLSDGVHT